MTTFKSIAYQILKEAGKPLHSKEITKRAEEQAEKRYMTSKAISSRQKGDIAEARVAELVTLYGETSLSCYKPISDDEGIDLIVKQKGNLKTMYIQIKSRFGSPERV